jgi:Stage II sporulation protein E (SpoIIE)
VCRIVLSLLLAILSTTASIRAQSPPTRVWPTGIVNENDGWAVHAGDELAYAAPTFDDSSWTHVTFSENFTLAGPDAAGHVRWMRKRIDLPPRGPINLMLIGDYASFEVYVDGVQIGPNSKPDYIWRRQNETIFPLSQKGDSRPSVEVAIRSHLRLIGFTRRLTFRSAAIGDPVSISALAGAHLGVRLGRAVFTIAVNALAFSLGILLLALFRKQRTHREYLWLGFTVVCSALSAGLSVAAIEGWVPLFIDCFVGRPALYLFMAAELSFVYAFIGTTPHRAIRIYQAILVTAPFYISPAVWIGGVPISMDLWAQSLFVFPGAILTVLLLAIWNRRGSREAGLLIVPILLTNATAIARDVEFIIRFAKPGFGFPTFNLSIVTLDYVPLAELSFLLSIGVVIFYRFLRVNREQAQTKAELESARTIQQFLVPQAFPSIPGLRVESVYLPAQQVGGDFFQIVALPAGGALVIMGDVSGKGLPAAMNVAMIVGALRTLVETTDSPAAILAGLNRRLRGRPSGFTTCIVLRILANGETTLANAGHINPYLSGREFATEASLPLGLDLDLNTTYPEITVTLAPGETLTLITDGVVEATDPQTKELFGFDRTLAISHLPAHQIAAVAQTFGQEDDIAVLTLQYLPA